MRGERACGLQLATPLGVGLFVSFGTQILPLYTMNARYEAIRLHVFPAGFWSCFGLILFHFPVFPFWSRNITWGFLCCGYCFTKVHN